MSGDRGKSTISFNPNDDEIIKFIEKYFIEPMEKKLDEKFNIQDNKFIELKTEIKCISDKKLDKEIFDKHEKQDNAKASRSISIAAVFVSILAFIKSLWGS